MINKKNLWFLTLFSLIIVLSVYYITMPSELLLTTNNLNIKEEKKDKKTTKAVSKEVEDKESTELVALRVESEEQLLDEINELKAVITNEKTTTEEKNRAFEKMQSLNQNRGVEETIEKKINTEYKLKSFVKIKDSDVTVVIDSNKHDKAIANKIMRTVQEQFETPMSITVKFQK